MGDIIFLLGAGASIDAGMPAVECLTKEFRQRLPKHERLDSKEETFSKLFDVIGKYDGDAYRNYEKFF